MTLPEWQNDWLLDFHALESERGLGEPMLIEEEDG